MKEKRVREKRKRTLVVPIRPRIGLVSAEVVVLGDGGNAARGVGVVEGDPRVDAAIDTVAKGGNLNREVVGEILSTELRDGFLRN
jgi:hypothetical protein